MQKLKIGILISGGGSNMHAIIKACQADDYPLEVVVVISNKPDAKGIKIARDNGITAIIIDHKQFDNREKFEDKLHDCLLEHGVELVCNAGFMRILTKKFVNAWAGQQVNIHPSLLPSFKGLNTHERVLEAGVKITGCSVHYVDVEVDAGTIIAQAAVPVLSDDNVETLATRVLRAEHLLYPHALRMIVEEKSCSGGNVGDVLYSPKLRV